MALQDLTPQLRTRLSRVERAVGWFVFLATALLVLGFGYYIYKTAQRKGWFTPKYKYQTWLNNAAGLKPGDPVKLMGRPVGQITALTPNKPEAYYGLTVTFTILKPDYGYIWDDSVVKVNSDFLGNRFLEVTKGVAGLPTIDEDTNKVALAMLNWHVAREVRPLVLEETRKEHPDMEQTNRLMFNWFLTDNFKRRAETNRANFYTSLTDVYGISPEESPALNERLERLANQIEVALPNILNFTNKIAAALDSTTMLTSNLNNVAVNAQPVIGNLKDLTTRLNGPGALGQWLLSSNMNTSLEEMFGTVDTNLPAIFDQVTVALDNLASMTSNLNAQVQANTNILSDVSRAVTDTDDLVQGLKRHWLLRSAFKTKK